MALTQWTGGPLPEIVAKMLAALEDDRGLESYPARLEAADYLLNRDPYSGEAVALCLEALTYGTRPCDYIPTHSRDVRKQAALILGKLELLYYDDRVYQALSRVMSGDEDGDVRDAAYEALIRMARVREQRSATAPG